MRGARLQRLRAALGGMPAALPLMLWAASSAGLYLGHPWPALTREAGQRLIEEAGMSSPQQVWALLQSMPAAWLAQYRWFQLLDLIPPAAMALSTCILVGRWLPADAPAWQRGLALLGPIVLVAEGVENCCIVHWTLLHGPPPDLGFAIQQAAMWIKFSAYPLAVLALSVLAGRRLVRDRRPRRR